MGGAVPSLLEDRLNRGGSLPADNGRCVTARGCTGEGAADAEKNKPRGRNQGSAHAEQLMQPMVNGGAADESVAG